MSGFANVRALVDAMVAGQVHKAHFRKVPSQASVAGQWVDLSMAAGNPQPNYYASTPQTAAVLDGFRGIFHGDAKAPASKHLVELALCSPTAGLVGAFHLLDYLLYYPFCDFDDTTQQDMDNTTTLPRYTSGEGVRAMMVTLAPTTGGGSFTYSYIDSKGVSRTSPTIFCNTATDSIATVPTSRQGAAPAGTLFLPMDPLSTGIQQITSLQMLVPNGGLCAIVLVKPIATATIREINTADERSYVYELPSAPRIYDGAYLNLIVNCAASVAAGILVGRATFVWN